MGSIFEQEAIASASAYPIKNYLDGFWSAIDNVGLLWFLVLI